MKRHLNLILFLIIDLCAVIACVLCYQIGHNSGYQTGFKDGVAIVSTPGSLNGRPYVDASSGVNPYGKPYDRPDSNTTTAEGKK